MIQPFRQPQEIQQFRSFFFNFLPGTVRYKSGYADVFMGIEFRKQLVKLENESYMQVPEPGKFIIL